MLRGCCPTIIMSTLFPETLTREQYFVRFLIWCVVFVVVSALLFPMVKTLGIPHWLPFLVVVPMFIMRFPVSGDPKMSGHRLVPRGVFCYFWFR